MSNLSSGDPIRDLYYQDLYYFRRALERMFGIEPSSGETNRPASWNLPLDISENENEYIVKASLPGVNPDDLDISVNGNTLTIRGEVKPEEEKGGNFHLRERRYGVFSRSFTLPYTIKADAIEASYDNGVLTLKLPKTETEKSRKIKVLTGPGK
ncbi:MAG TPA: Hsp20/alpha crystallin family protein [Anaerolineaceae bacterium]|nr:Hsp20/alpha crystallin family protein [Anaerolineaceae bacterium]